MILENGRASRLGYPTFDNYDVTIYIRLKSILPLVFHLYMDNRIAANNESPLESKFQSLSHPLKKHKIVVS